MIPVQYRWFDKHTYRIWPELQFVFMAIFFFNRTFSLSLCGDIKDKVDFFFIAVTLNGRKFDMLMYPDNLEN